MAMTNLTCKTLGDLDGGRAGAIIDAALSTMIRDLEERGHDGKARTVTITLTAGLNKGMVGVDLQAKPILPSFRTNLTQASIREERRSGGVGLKTSLYFQELNPENPEQPHFDAMDRDIDTKGRDE